MTISIRQAERKIQGDVKAKGVKAKNVIQGLEDHEVEQAFFDSVNAEADI